MNLKKILALAVCSMMALSSVASATITTDIDGWYLQDTKPTKASVEARAVSVTPAVEKIDLATAKTYGITAGKGASAKTDDNTDFYKITMTVNNIGELYAAYDINSDYATIWSVKMFNIAIAIPGISSNKQAVTSSTFEGKSWSIGGDGLQLTYGANSNEAYPAGAGEEGIYVNNPEVSVVAVYAVNKGFTLNVEPTVIVTYAVNGTEASGNASGVGTANVVLPPAVSTTTYTITFKTYDGASDVEVQTVDEGDTITPPTAPTRSGFSFAYWSEAQDGAEATIGTAAADKTYYAVYTEDPPAEEIINPVENKSEAQDIGTTALTDLQGKAVGEFKKNYGIAKFDTAITTGEKNYFVVATDDKAEEKQFAVDFSEIGVEAENANVSFFAIVKSATHKIASVVLKAVAK